MINFDKDGQFAAHGHVNPDLLHFLLDEPYFTQPPPKSTSREVFSSAWLDDRLEKNSGALACPPNTLEPADVQATLTALTATTIARDIAHYSPACRAIYVCGGGARNPVLMATLKDVLGDAGLADITLASTDALGVPAHQVKAFAFAWLAKCWIDRVPGNLTSVTGAAGPRVLGALYPS